MRVLSTTAKSAARRLIACVLCILALAGNGLTSAALGKDIINTATVKYVDKRGGDVTIKSRPVRTVSGADIPPAIRWFTDSSFARVALSANGGQPLFVQAVAKEFDLDPLVAETREITITSKLTGDRETFIGVETGPATGIFRIEKGVPTEIGAARRGDGKIQTLEGDILTAALAGASRKTVTTILIDPGGVVFNSETDKPLAGARVTLIDAATNAPARIFKNDGAPAASTVVTGADGRYVFPAIAAGSYRIEVVPPPGYTAPSKAAARDLPGDRTLDPNGSFGKTFAVSLTFGAVFVDVPVDPVGGGAGLFVQKAASRSTAEVGDSVDYTVRIKNVSGQDLRDVTLEDHLPHSFAFERGTARYNGGKVANPRGNSGPDLTFQIGWLKNDEIVTVTYRARIGADAAHGDGVNRAQAANDGSPRLRSNVATARVRVEGGAFTTRGVIFGKVYVDANRNRIQDDDDGREPGIPGVRIYMEDGTYAITDSEGKYSFYGIRPQTHVLKVDATTLPPGAVLEPLNTRHAGRGDSVFAEMKNSEMHKADFAECSATPEVLAYVEKMRAAAAKNERGDIASNLKAELNRDGAQLSAADPRSLPASGVITPGASVQATQQDRTQSADSVVLGGPRGAFRAPGATVTPGKSDAAFDTARPAVSGTNTFQSVLPPGAYSREENAQLPGTASSVKQPALPGENPVSSPVVAAAAAGVPLDGGAGLAAGTGVSTDSSEPFGFLDLKDRDTLPFAQANVRVRGVLGAKLALRVNGQEAPASRIGKHISDPAQNAEVLEYIGLALHPGENTLELAQCDPFGNERGKKTITVIAPGRLGSIRILPPAVDPVADGRTPARIRVELVDERGVPITARTALTLESSLGQWLAEDLNKTEAGTQVFIEGGRAEFALSAPTEPGDSFVRVSSGMMRADATISFLPELRPLIGAGVIEGKINVSHLSANSFRPTTSRDGFDEELRNFATNGNNTNAAGRAAFFLKGKIQGSYLLTAAYDSEKDTRERLFRDIQPDEFYPVYGDSSVKGFDAQSTGKLYVRIDNKKSYLLYGDFVTQSASDVRQLGNYNRSLTGAREHFENKNVSANAWASYDSTRQVIEELRANGTSGPYNFRSANGLVNSEKVEILTRDRNNPGLIIKTVPMTRFSDYEFEPFTGRILFKAPVPSLDADLNPVSIRVTYEVDQGGDKFWTYGADAQVKLSKRAEIGASAVRDENPLDHYGLYSANAAFDLGMKTFLLGEFAHSEDEIAGAGNAGRVELRHQSDRLSARVFWGAADNHFLNQAAILTAGRTEAGAQIIYKLAAHTNAIVQAVDTESREFGARRGVLAGIEQTFARGVRLELGGRYSTETRAPASLSTALTPGATPNEVRSARAKLTVPVPWTAGAAHAYGEYEQDVFDSEKRLAALGGEYQLDAKTRLYARHELISSLGGPFELNNAQQQNNTVVGVESAYQKDAALFNEYRARDAFTGRQSEAAIGLRNLWPLADGLRANTTFERVAPLEGVAHANESTAATAAVEYTGSPDWKGTARVEGRTSDSVNSFLNTAGLAYKVNQDWTALVRTIFYLAHNKAATASDQAQARVQAGLAWRQTDADVWNALGKYEYRNERGASGSFGRAFTSTDSTAALDAGKIQRQVHIVSLDVNYQPNADWLLSGHYAGKIALEDGGARVANLLVGRLTHDLSKRWDIGLNASALVSGDGRSVSYGAGPELGFTVADNLRVGVGYNLLGFTDVDLTEEQYTSRGFYLAMRLKLDESLLQRRRTKLEGGK